MAGLGCAVDEPLNLCAKLTLSYDSVAAYQHSSPPLAQNPHAMILGVADEDRTIRIHENPVRAR